MRDHACAKGHVCKRASYSSSCPQARQFRVLCARSERFCPPGLNPCNGPCCAVVRRVKYELIEMSFRHITEFFGEVQRIASLLDVETVDRMVERLVRLRDAGGRL